MAKVVAVHGIAQQTKGENTLLQEWLPALRDGLTRVNVDFPRDEDMRCAFYGDLFRKAGSKAIGDPLYAAEDVSGEWEKEMLEAWWREAAAVDRAVPGPEAGTKARTPQVVQRALNALCHSRFFAGVAERLLIYDLKQAYAYLNDERVQREARQRVEQCVGPDTRVLIGHSLGSVVAYETLCAHPEWEIRTFVTVGSPLGVRNLVFDKLSPAPQGGVGAWPGPNVRQWTNIADAGDVVALVKELSPWFGGSVEDRLVDNGATAHAIRPYLTTAEAGAAIAGGLTD